MKQWYVTVGVPGGEFAAKADDLADALIKIKTGLVYPFYFTTDGDIETFMGHRALVRSAPPELVEWLENKRPLEYVTKAPGGWAIDMLSQFYLPDGGAAAIPATGFIPVALASGITVLEDGDG